MASSTSPLLANQPKTPNTTTDTTSDPPFHPTKFTRTLMTTLGIARLAFGTACLLFPSHTFTFFAHPPAPGQTLIPRLLGLRDIVLAELLLTAPRSARSPASSGYDRRETRRALAAVAAADGLDFLVVCLAFVTGDIGGATFGWFAGVAGLGAVLAGEALWGCSV